MKPYIDIFFEFSSPYSYLAALELPSLAARYGRTVRWRPVELGKVWEAQGVLEPYLAVRKLKAPYILRDAAKVAAARGLPLIPWRSRPEVTLARLAVHRVNRCLPGSAELLARSTWEKIFVQGVEIGIAEDLARGLEPQLAAHIFAASRDERAAADLKAANEEAISLSCFGVPWILADGECYWGQDRIFLLEQQLARQARVRVENIYRASLLGAAAHVA
jgi:2-hydroxychromene-2-carboxylate isomerase